MDQTIADIFQFNQHLGIILREFPSMRGSSEVTWYTDNLDDLKYGPGTLICETSTYTLIRFMDEWLYFERSEDNFLTLEVIPDSLKEYCC